MDWNLTSMLFWSLWKVEFSRAAHSSFSLRQTSLTVEFSLKFIYSKIFTRSSAGSSTRASWRWAPPSRWPCVARALHRVSPSHSPLRVQWVRVWGLILAQGLLTSPNSAQMFIAFVYELRYSSSGYYYIVEFWKPSLWLGSLCEGIMDNCCFTSPLWQYNF